PGGEPRRAARGLPEAGGAAGGDRGAVHGGPGRVRPRRGGAPEDVPEGDPASGREAGDARQGLGRGSRADPVRAGRGPGEEVGGYFAAGGGVALVVPTTLAEAWKTPAIVRSIESRVKGFTTYARAP